MRDPKGPSYRLSAVAMQSKGRKVDCRGAGGRVDGGFQGMGMGMGMGTGRREHRPVRVASEVGASKRPVGQIPESLEVLGSRVAIIDVIGVFPHIAGQ